ncbi:hypothetical protein AYK21_02270 [Thermoplasmatales archaeon SG8-52-2]|nr:MAG: hypothetical protein AYK21_02270 [Thermoplasmatales archaeon SG8-52-2]
MLIKKIHVIGIIILLMGMSFNPSIAIDHVKKPSIPISNGYIQNLIDNASDGDTIYIPNGTYYENIVIDKSISLIGEHKNTTIINSNFNGNVVTITADWVNISGFTIQNSKNDYFDTGDVGILIKSNYNKIYSNNINSNKMGGIILRNCNFNILKDNTITYNGIIDRTYSGIKLEFSHKNTITSNVVSLNYGRGIGISESSNNNISYNIISNNHGTGILLFDYWDNRNNNITHNIISKNEHGIDIFQSVNNTIEFNNISNNKYGVYLLYNHKNFIIKNNFIKNKKHAYCVTWNEDELDSNFWDNWIGVRIKLPIFQRFPKIIVSFALFIPIIMYDWHPANKPYDT